MTLIPANVIAGLTAKDFFGTSPRIVTAQGGTIQSLAIQVNAILQNPPTFDSSPMFLCDVHLAGGGAGQNYTAQLMFREDPAGAFATANGAVFAVPYEGQTKQGLDLLFERGVKTIIGPPVVPGTPTLIAAVTAGAGNGAHYVGFSFWALTTDPATGAPLQIPSMQSGRRTLVNGSTILNIPTTSTTVVLVTLETAGPSPLAQQYKAKVVTVGLAGVVNIDGVDSTDAIIPTETSTVQWFAFSP